MKQELYDKLVETTRHELPAGAGREALAKAIVERLKPLLEAGVQAEPEKVAEVVDTDEATVVESEDEPESPKKKWWE